MREARVIGVIAALLLAGCGGRAESDGSKSRASAGSGVGGELGSGVAGATGAFDASAGEESGGSAGELGVPVLDISGRWGMFGFGDSVGVELAEDGGVLTGRGCANGAPSDDPMQAMTCGPISGSVADNQASFGFRFENSSDYRASVHMSADATRMTGRFHGATGDFPTPTAWLRIADGDPWLVPTPESKALPGIVGYYLHLTHADPGATEYTAAERYFIRADRGQLWGDLGSFFGAELTRPVARGPILVGPVPPTEASLPVSMVIELENEQFVKLSAVTASGHHYAFSATPSQ